MANANISSLHARLKVFRKILNDPENPVFDLLPSTRDAAIIG